MTAARAGTSQPRMKLLLESSGHSRGHAGADRRYDGPAAFVAGGCVRQVLQNGAAMMLVMRLGAERASCAR
ncbi:hypothetical protein, partial [Mesorhizobium sp. M0674]|uniref:hypothetical protein n=1 Tax=unclassified Mesorhizobium TaxID=325217 RepID=UPI00333BCB94